MKRSLNEIQGLMLKAARGAGVPLGLAEDLSAAVPFLIRNGALTEIVPIFFGAAFTGLVAAVADLDARECGHAGGMPVGDSTDVYAALAAARGLNDDLEAVSGAQDIPATLWSQLTEFAKRTYVPASEASRLAGAGAGLIDND